MAADCTRLPEGILINHSLAVASPVNTIIENGGTLYISTNASVATYVVIGLSAVIPQGSPLTFTTATGVVTFTGGTAYVVINSNPAGTPPSTGLNIDDSSALAFGTGLDVLLYSNGADLHVGPGPGAGAVVVLDTQVWNWGTGKDVVFTANGTDLNIGQGAGAGAWTFLDSLPVNFGTGKDIVFTINGTNVVLEQGAGAGLLLQEVAAFRIVDTTDNTKRASFVASGVTAGQTRSYTVPDFDYAPGVSTAPATAADPGTGAAIPVTGTTSYDLTTGTGAETNTMAIPTAVGQEISIVLGTAGGGTRTITVASAINQAGNTKIAATQANDWILLRGVSIAGTLAWRVAQNDGMTLS